MFARLERALVWVSLALVRTWAIGVWASLFFCRFGKVSLYRVLVDSRWLADATRPLISTPNKRKWTILNQNPARKITKKRNSRIEENRTQRFAKKKIGHRRVRKNIAVPTKIFIEKKIKIIVCEIFSDNVELCGGPGGKPRSNVQSRHPKIDFWWNLLGQKRGFGTETNPSENYFEFEGTKFISQHVKYSKKWTVKDILLKSNLMPGRPFWHALTQMFSQMQKSKFLLKSKRLSWEKAWNKFICSSFLSF